MSHGWVLYVEDAEADRLLMASAFRSVESIKLHMLPDGDAAISYLCGAGPYADRETHPFPDLIMLDLKLPGRSGHEVLKWIRSKPSFQALPVAVLTSSPQMEDIQEAYAAGANWYLIKPPQFVRLKEIVHLLERSQIETPGNFDALKELPECKPALTQNEAYSES
jgi:CheY-like chemotaxis protein